MKTIQFHSNVFYKYTGLYADKHKRNPFVCFDKQDVDEFKEFCDDLDYVLTPVVKRRDVTELLIQNKNIHKYGYIRKIKHISHIDYVFLSYKKDKIFYNLKDNIRAWKGYKLLKNRGKIIHENIKRLTCGIYDIEDFNKMSFSEFTMFLYPGLCIEKVSN